MPHRKPGRKSGTNSRAGDPGKDPDPFEVIDLPEIGDGDELPDHAEPTVAQQLAHARLMRSWLRLNPAEFAASRRELMHSERFRIT